MSCGVIVSHLSRDFGDVRHAGAESNSEHEVIDIEHAFRAISLLHGNSPFSCLLVARGVRYGRGCPDVQL